ncbi:MAG: aminotransferase class V-fold PLP-dependent enzyme [Carbonactinosporaceae bacterium]
MPINVEAARADTPGCRRVAHLNNAGAALPPQPVLDAVIDHLRLEAEIGGYEAAARRHDAVEHTYDALADLIGARRDEIAVVENATRAWDMAFYAIPFRPRERILTSTAEYASNALAFLQAAQRHDVQIDVVPDDESGQLDVDALRDMLDERVRLVAISHIPTQNGLVNPAAEVGKEVARLVREHGALYLLDACQSAGQLPLDVREIGCDLLSGTGRKFLRGPRGTGFLYCSRRVLDRLEPPFVDLHAATWTGEREYELRDDARRFENWETYYAGKIGLGVAADYALDLGLDAIAQRVIRLAEALRARLRDTPGVSVHDRGTRQCGIVTFTLDGHDPDDVAGGLRASGVNVSVSPGGNARFDPHAVTPCVRASVHYYNTEAELDLLCAALPR